MKNHLFFANFSIFLPFAVLTASWDPFFRIPRKFLHGYGLFQQTFHTEITDIDANRKKIHEKTATITTITTMLPAKIWRC